MKPFDLEAAKRGEPVQYASGAAVRFVAHVPESHWPEKRVICVNENGNLVFRKEDGTQPGCTPIVMATKKYTRWSVWMYNRSAPWAAWPVAGLSTESEDDAVHLLERSLQAHKKMGFDRAGFVRSFEYEV